MRVLGVLAAWGVLAVLATMCFALGGSIGYRRGVRDTLAQIRERRAGKAGCRPLPANHLRRRSSGHLRPGARARRARWRTGPTDAPIPLAPATAGTGTLSVLSSHRVTALAAACLAGLVLIAVPVTAVGASTAGPRDRMYGAKLAMEKLRLVAAISPERDAQVHVDLARARMAELSVLSADEDVDPAAIHRVSDEIEAHALAVKERVDAQQLDAPAAADLTNDIALVTRTQNDVVAKVADDECAEADSPDCAELERTRKEVVALNDSSEETAEDAGAAVALAATATPTGTPAPDGADAVADAVADDAKAQDTDAGTAEVDEPAGTDKQSAAPAPKKKAKQAAAGASDSATAGASAAPSVAPSTKKNKKATKSTTSAATAAANDSAPKTTITGPAAEEPSAIASPSPTPSETSTAEASTPPVGP